MSFRSLSVASADFHFVVAFLALYEAAPVELTPAPLHPLLPSRRVAPVAAHQLAAVDARTSLKERNGWNIIFRCLWYLIHLTESL